MELFKLLGTVAIDTTEANRNISDTTKKSQDLGDDFGKVADKAAEFSAKVLATTEAVVTAIGGMAVASSMQMESALDDFAASTGTVNEELAGYEDTLKEIYADNYGKSFEDIANSMAEIKKQVGDISADELKEMTEDALLLRDTFEFEVNESTRAAKMLMDQFGMTSKEAFNLIAQGAQNGLDKNGDLLDSINEYAVHYKQMGYSGQQFFNSLKNGTKAGTFSVDKLGDAMKEFGIRVKDTSTTTTDAFALIGYGAEDAIGTVGETGVKVIGSVEEIQAKFAAGGEQAQEATAEVINALFAMDDKVAQNAAGVGLFGTMWEDLGIDGIKALTKVEGGIDTATDALSQMADVKYDNLESEMDGLKKKVETTIITPLGQKVEPIISKLIKKVEKKLPQIKKLAEKLGNVVIKGFDKLEPAIEWLIDDAFPTFVDILEFCIENFETLIGVVGTFYGVVKTLTIINNIKTAVEGASGAFQIFNSVLGANPVMSVVTGVGFLVGGIATLVSVMGEEEDQLAETREKINEARTAREEELAAIDAERDAIDKKAEADLKEVARVEELWGELQTLCDESGNVKDADKARADFILGELNEALGTEYTMTGNQITQYGEMETAINDLIEAKKAEILLGAQEEKYKAAIENRQAALNELTTASIELDKQKEKTSQAELDYLKEKEEAEKRIEELLKEEQELSATGNSAKIGELQEERKELQRTVDEKETAWEKEKLWLDEKEDAYADYTRKYKGYCEDIDLYEQASIQMMDGNTAKAIEMLDSMGRAYQKASDLAGEESKYQIDILYGQMKAAETSVAELEKLIANSEGTMQETYKRQLESQKQHLENCKAEYVKAGGTLSEAIVRGYAENHDSASEQLQKYLDSSAENMKIDSFKTVGKHMAEGVASGIESALPSLAAKAEKMVNTTLWKTKKVADIHSPSRLFAKEVGAYIPSGIAMGIEDNEDEALNSVENMVGLLTTTGHNRASSSTNANATSITDSAIVALLIEKFNQLIAVMTQQRIYLNGDVLVGELAPAMNRELGNISALTERGQ